MGMGRSGRIAQLLALHVDHSQAFCALLPPGHWSCSPALCWWPGVSASIDTLELSHSSCLKLTFLFHHAVEELRC